MPSTRNRCRQVIGRWERGFAAPFTAVAATFLVMLLAAAFTLGQIVVQKEEMRTAVDAVALAATAIYERQGEAGLENNPGLAQMLTLNSHGAGAWTLNYRRERVEQPDGSFKVRFVPIITNNFTGESMVLGDDELGWQLHDDSASEITEIEFTEVERRLPKLVLVLDYSGSMWQSFGNGRTRIDSLRTAVNGLLDQQLDVEYGLVIFSSSVLSVVDVDADPNQDDIRQAMSARDPGGSTNYADPVSRAASLLTNLEDTGYYILLVGDGEPNTPGNGRDPAMAAADDARRRETTLFTLNIGGRGPQRDLMIAMGGGRGDAGDPAYFFEAGNDQQLQRRFRQIISEIICTVGPLEPAPDDPEYLFPFVVDPNGNETALVETLDLLGDAGELAYQYWEQENKLRLTERACDLVLENRWTLLIRQGIPRLEPS